MKKILTILAAAALAAPGFAVVVTFDGFGAGTVLSGANAVSPDFTISGTNGTAVRAATGPNFTVGGLQDDIRSGYRIDFNIAGVSSASIDLGDFNQDSENIYLSAFDSGNNHLGTVLGFLPASQQTYSTLAIFAGTDISYILFGGDTGNQGFFNSVYFDNLNYSSRAPGGVPDSGASVLLLGVALCGLVGLKRRVLVG
jgi:hypothetical protein